MKKEKRVIDFEGMKRRAEEERDKEMAEFSERINKLGEKDREKQAHIQDLMSKAMEEERAERTAKRNKQIEKEQEELKAKQQAQLEKEKGIKSDETVRREEAFLGMVEDINKRF